jgi:hypothetical protein
MSRPMKAYLYLSGTIFSLIALRHVVATYNNWSAPNPDFGSAQKRKTPQAPKRLRGNDLRFMGLGRVELPTSRLSGVRSNHLSYRPFATPNTP